MKKTKAKSIKTPKGGPALIILLLAIVAPTALIGNSLGAGQAGIIGGFIAMFTLISCLGGGLRSNLKKFIVVGPLIAIFSVAPRILAEYYLPAGIILAIFGIFIAGLLPLRSRRYSTASIGLGTSTLLGYSLPIGTATIIQMGIAAIASVFVVLIILILLGIKDPTLPTRRTVADLFADTDSNFASIFESWITDGAQQWLGTVITAAVKFRLARAFLKPRATSNDTIGNYLTEIQTQADELAKAIKQKTSPDIDTEKLLNNSNLFASRNQIDSYSLKAIDSMIEALNKTSEAVQKRDSTSRSVPIKLRRQISISSVRSAFGGHAIQFRHTLRTTIAVSLTFLISLFIEHGDPLLPTLLVTSFALIQTSKNETFYRAKARFLGIVTGGLLAVLIITFCPTATLFPISMVALAIGMWFIADSPAIGTAALIIMSVGYNFEIRHIDPLIVLIEYFVLAALAIVISSIIGFTVVPNWQPPSLLSRSKDATASIAAAFTALRIPRNEIEDTQKIEALVHAHTSIRQLAPDHETLSNSQREHLKDLRQSLENLLAVAVFQSLVNPDHVRPHLLEAEKILNFQVNTLADDNPENNSDLVMLSNRVLEKQDQLGKVL